MNGFQALVIDADTPLTALFRDVHNYWSGLMDGSELPDASRFMLDELPSALLPWSILADVIHTPRDYLFRFWGTERSNLIGNDMTRKRLSEVFDERMREGNRDEYEEVLKSRSAMLFSTPIRTSIGRETELTSIRLPLKDEAGQINRIFSAIDPTTINESHYAFYGTEPRRGL